MTQTGEEFAKDVRRVAAARTKSRSLRPLRDLLPYLLPYRWRIAAALAALVCSATVSLLVPQAVRIMIDRGFHEAVISRIGLYFLPLVIASGLLGLFTGVRFYYVSWIGERVIADLRKAVFDHVLSLTPAFFEITRTGEVLSRLTADTTLIQTIVGSSVSIALRNALMFVGGIALMFATSIRLTLIVLGAVLFVLLPLILFGRWVRALSRSSQDRIADTSARASETINAVQTVQAFTQESAERQRFGATVEESFAVSIVRNRARAVMSAVVIFAIFSSIVGVAYIGAHDVAAKTMTPGLLVQFIFYALLVGLGVGALSEIWGDLQRAAGASERLTELLRVEPEVKAPVHPAVLRLPSRGEIAFREVTFRYPSRPETAALDSFSLAVTPGEAIALVGPSGAGKSTVFQLALRFYAPQAGTILFDGIDCAKLDPAELRRQMALVAQDPIIFSGTIADNIRYGCPGATDQEVRTAAEAAAAAEFVETLPQGYRSLIGERGTTLSGGQRQRIAIARAILRDAPLLLLDEATSALDAENERLVQTGLANLMAGRTTIVIAHRLATIQRLARIVVMDRGRVVAEGSHAELVAGGGLYARLADLQFAAGLARTG